jgi:hypothetical protein
MKLTIESSDKVTTIDGVDCRIWEGWTESGTRCVVLVHEVLMAEGEDWERFGAEMREIGPPKFHIPPILLQPPLAPNQDFPAKRGSKGE